ncbi:MAG TPA: nuclear transport factor 2 family protein [Actinomycetes bacterium]|nr:nuclear transport factor 2 family protein [Actinomycetes bacterium]
MGRKLDNAVGLYLDGIRDGNFREAVAKYTAPPYKQHSTGVADGPEGFVEFFEGFVARNPQRDIRIVRAFEDGRYVFVHAYQSLNGGQARWVTTDLFDTDEQDRLIEHWDVISAFQDRTVSGHSQLDGPTEITDLDRTEANKALVREFLVEVMQKGNVDRVTDYISTTTYIQHNPQVGDGLQGLNEFLGKLARGGGSMVYDQVHKVVGRGNFVASLSQMNLSGQLLAVFDLWRVQDGLIVEHWDNMEPLPIPEQARNSGKF